MEWGRGRFPPLPREQRWSTWPYSPPPPGAAWLLPHYPRRDTDILIPWKVKVMGMWCAWGDEDRGDVACGEDVAKLILMVL